MVPKTLLGPALYFVPLRQISLGGPGSTHLRFELWTRWCPDAGTLKDV